MVQTPPDTTTVTRDRAARLAKFLKLLASTAKTRSVLMTRLKTDQRAFYRDLRFLRSLGIEVTAVGDKYLLGGPLDAARARLPCPDPGLTMAEAAQLCRGTTEGHRKLKRMVESINGPEAAMDGAGVRYRTGKREGSA